MKFGPIAAFIHEFFEILSSEVAKKGVCRLKKTGCAGKMPHFSLLCRHALNEYIQVLRGEHEAL